MTAGVSAHRGGNEVAAEASLAAYRAACEAGVDLIEVDVRRLADGTLVCAHDAGGPGDPLLADVLDLAAAHGVGGHVDVKESGYEAELVAFVAARLATAYYTTGDAAAVERLCAAGGLGCLTVGSGLAGRPPWTVVRLLLRDLFPYARITACGAQGVAVQFRFCTPWLRRWLRRRGLVCLVYTVDGTWSIRRRLRQDLTAVVTDRPLRALQLAGRDPARG